MLSAEKGDTIKVHYTGSLDDGTVFDSSTGRDPLEFKLGAQAIIVGLENAVLGLGVGDKKSVVVAPEDAYGPHHADRVIQVERTSLPDDLELELGMMVRADSPQGPVVFVIAGMTQDSVTLDGNHPLAGKQLHFELEVVDITRV